MNTINELLAHYKLDLSECNDEWVDMVKEFRNEKPAMPAEVAAAKEKEIVDQFLNFHVIEDEEPAPPVEKKKTGGRPKGTKLPAPVGHEYDEKSLLDRADDIINKIF